MADQSFADQMAVIRSIERMRPRFAGCRSWMRFVHMSNCHPLTLGHAFLLSSTEPTYQPSARTIGFGMVAYGAGGPGEWNPVEMTGQETGIVP